MGHIIKTQNQGRAPKVRTIIKTKNAESTSTGTSTVVSVLPGITRRARPYYKSIEFKGVAPGSGGGQMGNFGSCYGYQTAGGSGGDGVAGSYISINVNSSSSMSSYTIVLGSNGIYGTNVTNNTQDGAKGADGRAGGGGGGGGSRGGHLIFNTDATIICPSPGAGGGGGGGGKPRRYSPLFDPAVGGLGGGYGGGATSSSYGKSGNGGDSGYNAFCYTPNTRQPGGTSAAANSYAGNGSATYIFAGSITPPSHGITAWTTAQYGKGGTLGVGGLWSQGNTSAQGANAYGGVFRLTINGIRF